MSEVRIGEDYRIVTDPLNYTLQRRKIVKKARNEGNEGAEYWTVVGYYPDLTMLTNYLVERDLLAGEWTAISDVVRRVEALKRDIAGTLRKVLPEKPGDQLSIQV